METNAFNEGAIVWKSHLLPVSSPWIHVICWYKNRFNQRNLNSLYALVNVLQFTACSIQNNKEFPCLDEVSGLFLKLKLYIYSWLLLPENKPYLYPWYWTWNSLAWNERLMRGNIAKTRLRWNSPEVRMPSGQNFVPRLFASYCKLLCDCFKYLLKRNNFLQQHWNVENKFWTTCEPIESANDMVTMAMKFCVCKISLKFEIYFLAFLYEIVLYVISSNYLYLYLLQNTKILIYLTFILLQDLCSLKTEISLFVFIFFALIPWERVWPVLNTDLYENWINM